MSKPLRDLFVIFVLVLATAAPVARSAEPTPEDVVKRYLAALQSQKFEDAYELVSAAMKTDRKTGKVKSKDVWVKESQYLFAFSEMKIFDFVVGTSEIQGKEAVVPNLLSSQDKFINQLGLDEFELYTLVRENGAWKVDRQHEVTEREDIAKWFPGKAPKP